MDSDNQPITLCLLCSQEPPKACNVLRTFHSPSESIRPMGVRFCCVVLSKAQLPNPLHVLSKTQPLAEVIADWLLDMGYGLLVIGGKAAYPCLYTLHPTLYTDSPCLYTLHPTLYTDSPCLYTLHPTLYTDSPCLYTLHPTLYTISDGDYAFNPSPAFRQCFDAATKQMQQRYIVSRVKTDVVFGRTLILRRTMNGSKNIEIYLVRLSDEG